MADEENGDSQSGTPQAFLNSVVGQPVWVRLNSGIDYKGGYTPSIILYRFCSIADSVRSAYLPGWVYECRFGANGGIRQWSVEEKIWRLFRTRE